MGRVRSRRLILFYNIVLTALAVLIIFLGRSAYQKKWQETSLRENRFITTEWQLLQIIKQQAEDELEKKNQEIRRLWDQYELLKIEKADRSSLRELEEKIKAMEEERDAILDQMVLNLAGDREDKQILPDISQKNPIQSLSIYEIITKRELEELRVSQQSARREIEELGKEVSLLRAEKETLASTVDLNKKELQERIITGDKTMAEIRYDITAIMRDLKSEVEYLKEDDELSLSLLYNYELVMAILGLPEIKKEYPDLQGELELYVERLNDIERSKGEREANLLLLDALEGLKVKLQ